MAKLKDLDIATMRASIDWNGQAIGFTFRTKFFTPKYLMSQAKELNSTEGKDYEAMSPDEQASEIKNIYQKMVDNLADIIASWEIEDDEGVMVPITAKFIKEELPVPMIEKFKTAISDTMYPPVKSS